MQAEELVRSVQAWAGVQPARAAKRLELLDRIFVRVLGVDALALGETERAAQHAHRLRGKAHEMHLDAAVASS